MPIEEAALAGMGREVGMSTPVAAEHFALDLMNLADQLDESSSTQGAVAPTAGDPGPAADSATSPAPEAATTASTPATTLGAPADAGELDSYEPPALDAQACLRTFPVLNPRCHRAYLEQFRVLRTRLCLEQRNWTSQQRDLRVISVLSPSAGDGRSFVAANLAAALAVSDAQVLLVDVNTGAPQLHESLGVPPVPGLTEALKGPRHLANQAWWTVLHRVPETNLFAMTLGAGGSSQIDTVDLQKLPSLMEHWRPCFDWVILDGPAFDVTSDAEILSHIADATLLIVRPGHTSFAEVQESTSRIPAEKLLGVVMNSYRR